MALCEQQRRSSFLDSRRQGSNRTVGGMTEPGKRPVIEQMPAWMGHPFLFIVFGGLLVGALLTFVSSVVGFTTWFRVIWSAFTVLVLLWPLLLTVGVWRRDRRKRVAAR